MAVGIMTQTEEFETVLWTRRGPVAEIRFNRPHRLKIRSACLSNLQALKDMTVGGYIADAVVVLGSLDIVLCEVDR